MAYDVELADRLREVLATEPDVREKQMFGGLAFLVGGHMAVAAGSDGGLLLRCDPTTTEAHALSPGVERYVMRGRAMDGWLAVPGDVVADDEELRRWVEVGSSYAATLPPKCGRPVGRTGRRTRG